MFEVNLTIFGTLRCGVAIKESYPVFTQGQVHSRCGSTEWRPEDGEAKQTGVRQVLSVGETVHLIMLQLLVGLPNTCHHQASLSLFREILPLLQPPKDQCLSEEVSDDFIPIMPCCQLRGDSKASWHVIYRYSANTL
jgi:hypothetical protein